MKRRFLSKDELIGDITSTIEIVKSTEEFDKKYINYFTKSYKINLGGHISASILIAGFITLIISIIKEEFMFGQMPIFILLYLAFIVIVENILVKYFIKTNKEFYETYPAKRRELILELNNVSSVPPAFWNSTYLTIVQNYLRIGRADTLKEAINLLEYELRINVQLRNLAAIQKQLSAPRVGVLVRF